MLQADPVILINHFTGGGGDVGVQRAEQHLPGLGLPAADFFGLFGQLGHEVQGNFHRIKKIPLYVEEVERLVVFFFFALDFSSLTCFFNW